MEKKLARYFELRQKQKELDEEIDQLRKELLDEYKEPTQTEIGDFQLKISYQERREYDDQALYNALPDASVWRLISKADGGKIASLIKLNVISEEILANTYKIKKVPYIQVTKK